MPDNPDQTCGTCSYWFNDSNTGFGGCALLLEMENAPLLGTTAYNELDEWAAWFADGVDKGDCPQWKENEGFYNG